MRAKLYVGAIVAALSAVLAFSAVAQAKTATEVTIKYNGDGFQGKVKSSKSKCVAERTVNVYKANGEKQYTDTSDENGRWNTGNSGQVSGRFYAKVKKSESCKGAKSDTINV